MVLRSRFALTGAVAAFGFTASLALAQAATQSQDEDVAEARLADGDVDAEDFAVMDLRPATASGSGSPESWVSLAGARRTTDSGGADFMASIVVGLALDRVGDPSADASQPALSDPAKPAPPSVSNAASASAWLTPRLARGCVVAAFRAAGLGPGDARLEALADRARKSALLPETRLRAARRWDDASHTTTLATTDGTATYDGVGANLLLEMRLTWRLDRLLFDGSEAALERARLDRQEARSRLTTKTLDALFGWARALTDVRAAVPGSREALDAGLRVAEEEATLEVLTGGWFSAASRPPSRPPSPPEPTLGPVADGKTQSGTHGEADARAAPDLDQAGRHR